MKECKSCGAFADDTDTQCRYCGNILRTVQQQAEQPGAAYSQPGYTSPGYGPAPEPPPDFQTYTPPYPQQPVPPYAYPNQYRKCDKITAGVLAILLGGFGAHKFYMGKPGKGILYLLFCFTSIPSIIGLIEGIMYLCMDDAVFREKYCRLY